MQRMANNINMLKSQCYVTSNLQFVTQNAVAICPAAGQIAFETFFCYLSGRRTNSLKWSEMLFVRLLINKI